MNTPLLIATILVTLSFFAHAIGGTKESLKIKPKESASAREWVQLFSAWHLVTADLFLVSVLSILMMLNYIPESWTKGILVCFVLQFGLWTLFWLGTLLFSSLKGKYIVLFQWILFIVLSVLYAVSIA